jgi:hypothetical protein
MKRMGMAIGLFGLIVTLSGGTGCLELQAADRARFGGR